MTEGPKTIKLFVNRGERSGIDEEDLRWALREGAVLPDDAVHDVRVLHRFSFVEVDPDQAERTVEYLDGTKLKGKEIRLEVGEELDRRFGGAGDGLGLGPGRPSEMAWRCPGRLMGVLAGCDPHEAPGT